MQRLQGATSAAVQCHSESIQFSGARTSCQVFFAVTDGVPIHSRSTRVSPGLRSGTAVACPLSRPRQLCSRDWDNRPPPPAQPPRRVPQVPRVGSLAASIARIHRTRASIFPRRQPTHIPPKYRDNRSHGFVSRCTGSITHPILSAGTGAANPKLPSVTVGPNSMPIPQKVVQKILKGDYVDMAELLPEKLSHVQEPQSSQSSDSKKPKRKRVGDILQWL